MKTLEEIKDLMVGKSVITNLVDLLRTNDEEFAESEKKYLAALETLRTELPSEFTPTPDDYLAACESDAISAVAYAGYLGFRVNLENFHHPIGIDFVQLDTIDYLKDHLFGHFPVNYRNAQVREAFHKGLPVAFVQLQDDIQDYFTHMECAGPKLAHYAGYIIGNHILPWVEPGYREDVCQTIAFAEQAVGYCTDGRVRYLCVQNGVGQAYVAGTKWYWVDFRFNDGMMTDIYCDCPYSELCKHEVAVALTLRMLFKQPQFKDAGDFMALDRWVFWHLASRAESITI